MTGIDRLSNKEITYRYHGATLRFMLSHALFSSNSIDDGTNLLLKTMSSSVDFSTVGSVLDVGCGTGVLGIAVASAANATLVGQDRDALAASFSSRNAEINDLHRASFTPALALSGLGDNTFDLVLSNIPAKAGRGVISGFLAAAPAFTSSNGAVWVVIVQPLSDMARDTIEQAGHEIFATRDGPGHCVIGYRGNRRDVREIPWEAYVRQQTDFTYSGVSYSLETVYGLPDFDTFGYPTSMILKSTAEIGVEGTVLVLDPGQGHIPVWLCSSARSSITTVAASRDTLQLEASRRNVEAAGHAIEVFPFATYDTILEHLTVSSCDMIIAPYEPIPGVPHERPFLDVAEKLLASGGHLITCSKSTYAARLLKERTGLSPLRSKKHKGYRTAVWKKR